MKTITSPNHPNLECQIKPSGDKSDSLKKLEEVLGTPIEQQEVWIKYDGGAIYNSWESKYADFYPQFDLLVKTAQAETDSFIHVEKPLNDNFLNTEGPEWLGECLDAIAETYDSSTESEQFLLNSEYIPKFVNEDVLPALGDDIQVCGYDFNQKLVSHIYKLLTSAKYHHRIMRLFSKADAYYNAFPSSVRQSEVENLFGVKLPNGGMENFAVDYGQFILYFHMDDRVGGYKNIHFNHYRYNNGKDEMSFFEGENDNAFIPYDEWKSLLDAKPVIIFGYDERMKTSDIPDLPEEPLLKFLGSHENTVDSDEQGNYKFSLLHTYDFTI